MILDNGGITILLAKFLVVVVDVWVNGLALNIDLATPVIAAVTKTPISVVPAVAESYVIAVTVFQVLSERAWPLVSKLNDSVCELPKTSVPVIVEVFAPSAPEQVMVIADANSKPPMPVMPGTFWVESTNVTLVVPNGFPVVVPSL